MLTLSVIYHRGSNTPEGAGACPAGHFCPAQTLAIHCPLGNYCPGSGNTSPLPCYPGSYSDVEGLSFCTPCEIGYQCPGVGRSSPELCQAGYVCDKEGTAIPSKRCPSGHVCEEGTTTDDPTSLFGVPPKACPAGSFCLEGVATNNNISMATYQVMSWLPLLPSLVSRASIVLQTLQLHWVVASVSLVTTAPKALHILFKHRQARLLVKMVELLLEACVFLGCFRQDLDKLSVVLAQLAAAV